ETRRSIAELFSELLLDDQSGLSRRTQEQIAHVALAAVCADYNHSVVNRLQNLSSERFDALVRPWLDQQFDQAPPEAIGQDFFLVAPHFNAYRRDWPEKLGTWVTKRGVLAWSVGQIRDAVATSGYSLEVSVWAGARLPLLEWLSPYGIAT